MQSIKKELCKWIFFIKKLIRDNPFFNSQGVLFFFEPDRTRHLIKLGMLSLSGMKRLGKSRQNRGFTWTCRKTDFCSVIVSYISLRDALRPGWPCGNREEKGREFGWRGETHWPARFSLTWLPWRAEPGCYCSVRECHPQETREREQGEEAGKRKSQ